MTDKNDNQERCSECGLACNADEIRIVDGKNVCLNCLCGQAEPIEIRPIGIVVNDKKRNKKGFGTEGGDVSEIRLHPGQERFMKALADETHLTIIWNLHQSRPVKTAFHRGWDGKEVGPFASRTPDRLTPIAITDVELIEVRGTTLIVRGLDAIDGTPVLDIKVSKKSLKRDG
jgi:tRNA (Thr-GGU) A37 N-methylase